MEKNDEKISVKKIIFVLLLVLSLTFGGYLLKLYIFSLPYNLYDSVILKGESNKYFKLSKINPDLFKGRYFLDNSNHDDTGRSLWKVFSLSYLNLALPAHHPQYVVIPDVIDVTENFTSFGLKFTDTTGKELATISFEAPYRLPLNISSQKIFNLPIFKQKILDTSLDVLWKDVFLKNLILPDRDKGREEITLEELGYNLFVYNLRLLIFKNEKVEKLQYFQEKSSGIIEMTNKDSKDQIEKIYFLYKGYIFSAVIKTDKWDELARSLRNIIISRYSFNESRSNSAFNLYGEHKNLSYQMKLDQEGMLYLYSAWSHDPARIGFLKECIFYLEKGGEVNKRQLRPLYDYAYKKYGSNFSIKDLKDSALVRLQRKTQEELEKEIYEERMRHIDDNDYFKTKEEREKFILQKVKDDKVNYDDKEDVLRLK